MLRNWFEDLQGDPRKPFAKCAGSGIRPVWSPILVGRTPPGKRAFLVSALVLCMLSPLGANEPTISGQSALSPKQAHQPIGSDYVVSADDLLEIDVFDVPELSRQYRVRPNGSIALPLIPGPILAAGSTTDQLAEAIRNELKANGLVNDPAVTVEVKESRLHSVAVMGAVRKPQIYPVFGRTTLLDVLAQAEGLVEDAGELAVVTRGETARRAPEPENGAGETPQESDTVFVDLRRLMETNDPRLNLELYPGDRVTVERAGVVYVVGAVNRSGGFVLDSNREPMTVLKALALAEDLKPTALANKALIIRPRPLIEHREPATMELHDEIPVRLKDILAGRAPDQPLQPSDILFVPDSNSRRALRRAAEAAVQITTGVIIWRR